MNPVRYWRTWRMSRPVPRSKGWPKPIGAGWEEWVLAGLAALMVGLMVFLAAAEGG